MQPDFTKKPTQKSREKGAFFGKTDMKKGVGNFSFPKDMCPREEMGGKRKFV
jgi:hypothetical protein